MSKLALQTAVTADDGKSVAVGPGKANEAPFERELVNRRIHELIIFADSLGAESFRQAAVSGEAKSMVKVAIRYAVKEFGIEQSKIADLALIDPSTVSRWVKGSASPPRRHVLQVIDAIRSLIDIRVSELSDSLNSQQPHSP